jgi:GNAT superfamily N-acetyltransferase
MLLTKASNNPKHVEMMIIWYIKYLIEKRRLGRGSIHTYCFSIFHFFDMNDINLNRRKILRLRFLPRLIEKMGSYHPKEPHWYLPLLGVDPLHHGKGLGSVLLQHALAVCDRDNKFAYLESSNSRNITLYERHGFKLLGTIQVNKSPTSIQCFGSRINYEMWPSLSSSHIESNVYSKVVYDGWDRVMSIQDGYGLMDKFPPGAPPITSFIVTFEKPGTYSYLCTAHPWMTGTVGVT